MFMPILVFATLTLQVWLLLFNPAAPANALNEKWRMYERARSDSVYDKNYRFFQLSGD